MDTLSMERLRTGKLRLDASVVMASGRMSADEVDAARTTGGLTLQTPEGDTVRLEAGGMTVAEGRMRQRHGKTAFVVTHVYGSSEEEHS